MQLVENHGFQPVEEPLRFLVRDQQCQLLRRRQQDLRRIELLPLAPGNRCVAGAGLDLQVEADFIDRRFQVPLDVDRQCLERRDIEGMNAPFGLAGLRPGAPGKFDKAGQETGQGLAGAGRRNQQGGMPGLQLREQFQLVRPRLPAMAGKPFLERIRQEKRKISGPAAGKNLPIHAPNLGPAHGIVE